MNRNGPTKLNVLSLGFTRTLWEKPTDSQGDTHERLLGYGRHLESYHIITHSLRRHQLVRKLQVAESVWAYATNGFTVLDSWARMIPIGLSIARQFKLDLIQAQDPLFTGSAAYLLSRILHLPYNVCVYGPNPFDPYWLQESRLNRFGAPGARYVLSAAHGIQVDGSATRRALIESGLTASKIRIKPIMSAAIEQFFAANRVQALRRTLLNGTPDGWLWLCAGRVVAQKNLGMLIEIASRIRALCPNVQFICIGDGPELTALRRETHRRSLEGVVQWLGPRSHREVARYMSASDGFILTSFYEGFARVLMEGAAAGLPIVTTAVSGSDDAVTDQVNGFITPIGDIDSMVEAMVALMSNRQRAREMGQMGTVRMRALADRYLDPYSQVKIWEELCEPRH